MAEYIRYDSEYLSSQMENALGRAMPGGELDLIKAPLYVSAATYAAGAAVIHNGFLWINTSGTTTTGVEPGTNYNVWNVTYCNPNLLDNPYFPGPVNQRGVSGTISSTGYFIDRWKLTSGSVTLGSTGITLNGTIVQISETAWGTNVHASVIMVSGSATISYNNTTKTTTITSSGGVIQYAKLEIGSISTAANDAPPDNAMVLSKCQRYYVDGSQLKFYSVSKTIEISGDYVFMIPVIFPTTMRTTPSLTTALLWSYGCTGTATSDATKVGCTLKIYNSSEALTGATVGITANAEL